MDEAQTAIVADLAAQMFAEPIATGEVVVTDPGPEATLASVALAATPSTSYQAPSPSLAPVPEPPPEAEPEAVATPESVPTFKPKLNDDLQALLDEPDFDEEARLEVANEVENDEYTYDDPETAARERAKDKRIQFLETQLVAKSKRGWVEEAKRAYPDLARLLPGEIEAINASSRRAFIREADKKNSHYQTVLAPTLAKLEAERVAIAAGAMQVARGEVHASWGKPAADTLPPIGAAQADALAKARATGSLEESIKVLMETTPVLP